MMTKTPTNPRAELRRLETIVERGLHAFLDVSAALVEIRDRGLFREHSQTWQRYLLERWAITRRLDWAAPLFDQAAAVEVKQVIGCTDAEADRARDLAGLSPALQQRIFDEAEGQPIDEAMKAVILRDWATMLPEDQAAIINREEAKIAKAAAALTAAQQRADALAACVKALEKARKKAALVDADLEEAVAKVLTRARATK